MITGMCIINTVSGAIMYSQLKDPRTYIFMIADVAEFYPLKPGGDTSNSGTITQTIEPFLEWLFSSFISVVGKLVWSCLHVYDVSYTILYCKF